MNRTLTTKWLFFTLQRRWLARKNHWCICLGIDIHGTVILYYFVCLLIYSLNATHFFFSFNLCITHHIYRYEDDFKPPTEYLKENFLKATNAPSDLLNLKMYVTYRWFIYIILLTIFVSNHRRHEYKLPENDNEFS